MARPKIFDYDPAEDYIENYNIEGFRVRQITFRPYDQMAVITLEEGYVSGAGDEITPVKNKTTQINIDAEGAKINLHELAHPETFVEWYVANKQLFDDMHSLALVKASNVINKTGSIISS